MRLPPELEEQLWQALGDLERTKAMPYVTSVERIGFQRGHVQGREEGLEEGRRAEAGLVSRLVRRRFGAVPEEITERIAALSKDRIEALGDALLDFASLDDLEAWLQRH
jgi:flagellar biosynthesis/type III secretory pathway protein FliH